MFTRLLSFLLPLTVLLFLSACQRDEIKTYRVAKEKEAAPAHTPQAGQPAMPPGHPPLTPDMSTMPAGQAAAPLPSGPGLTWTAPGHWTAKALGAMRRGSYSIKGAEGSEADLSIFVFPGAAGGLADNINRWRGQISLAPLEAAKLADEITPLKSDSGLELHVVDMAGQTGERIIGAILEQGSDSWFFKLKGPDALVASEKSAFLAFLETVKQP